MAQSELISKNGAVSAAGIVADYTDFDIASKQVTETITPYGTAVTCSRNIGNGTPDFTTNVNGIALAHASNTPLAMPSLSATGAAATFTLDTGVTETGTFITSDINVSHSRMKAAVRVKMTLRNAGEVTEAWVTT